MALAKPGIKTKMSFLTRGELTMAAPTTLEIFTDYV
jgi:hypothetical protein